MNGSMYRRFADRSALVRALAAACVVLAASNGAAQQRGEPRGRRQAATAVTHPVDAPVDLTGYWVSLVSDGGASGC